MISVIMGVYNSDEEKLKKAIDSILNQTYTEFEFIICDDGSTNNTWELLLDFERVDSRIRLLKNPQNMGLAYSLNNCITESENEILIRQDDDDYSAQNRFEKILEFMSTNKNIDIVSSNIALFDDSGIWGQMKFPKFPQKKDFLFCVPFMHGAVAYKKSAVLTVGAYNTQKRYSRVEDIDLFMRMYANGSLGATIEEHLYFYREDNNAVKKRKYKYKIDEAIVKYRGYKLLGLMPRGIIYAIKPLVVGLIPNRLLNSMKDVYYMRRK